MGQILLETTTRETSGEMPGVAGCYLRFCAAHLDQIAEYIAEQDLASVSRIARKLRTNARRVGLSELASLGGQLEEYCLGTDWRAVNSAFQAISSTVSRLCEGTPAEIEVRFEPDDGAKELHVERTG